MFVENFSKFIKYYGEGRKLKLFGFLILSVVVGLLELTGIALVYPFILLIINPQGVVHSKYYLEFVKFTHLNNFLVIAFLLGIFAVLIFIIKNIFMVFSLYLQNKFTNNWKLAISEKIMKYYLYSSYKDSIKISPAEKGYNITMPVSQSIDNFILRLINLTTNIIIITMILTLLFLKFPFAAILTGSFVVFCVTVQSKFFKRTMREISKKLVENSISANEKLGENIGNIKEIKVLSSEDYFYSEYVQSQKKYNETLLENNFYSGIPPYIVEILVMLSLVLMGGIISIQNINNTSWMVASYAVIVASIFRIAPALNRVQTSINNINASRDFVKMMILEYEKTQFKYVEEKSDIDLKFNHILKLKDICFSYKEKYPIIKNLDLEIKKGEFIGIIGLSGAGKSTLADIIMGLLPIDSGEIFVDDTELNQSNFSALRKLAGYVPQDIRVLDGSIKRNVAWGVREEEIDEQKVIEALKQAQMYDFVSKLDGEINSKSLIGLTGMSQGQKQRLAIARALYKNSEVLIFDEATSSLDVETEHSITQMLNQLKSEKTIIAIAHRLSTLKSCDRLIYLKDGKIVDTGSFEELAQKYPDFEKLIKLSSLQK